MDEAQRIRKAVADVAHLRQMAKLDMGLQEALSAVKQFQSHRFAHTYRDLAEDHRYRTATHFFLTELYGEQSYDERDAQFSRIAGALQRLLPKSALQTALSLADLHCLSERLDFAMAQTWLVHSRNAVDVGDIYVTCWRSVSQRDQRESQLNTVLRIGEELARLTKVSGLRLLLSAMRSPAQAAGLGSLQHFLESGFDSFKSLTIHDKGSRNFLEIIRAREKHLMALMFDGEFEAVRAALQGE